MFSTQYRFSSQFDWTGNSLTVSENRGSRFPNGVESG